MKQTYYIVFLIVFGLLCRLLPHPVNFAAMTAVAVLSARYIKSAWAYVVPIICFVVADLFYGFHATMFFTYGSQILIVFLARQLHVSAEQKSKFIPLSFLSAAAGSVIFFVLSNLGVFLEGMLYPQTWEGFVNCYLMAIPFFKNQIAGDVITTAIGLTVLESIKALASASSPEKSASRID